MPPPGFRSPRTYSYAFFFFPKRSVTFEISRCEAPRILEDYPRRQGHTPAVVSKTKRLRLHCCTRLRQGHASSVENRTHGWVAHSKRVLGNTQFDASRSRRALGPSSPATRAQVNAKAGSEVDIRETEPALWPGVSTGPEGRFSDSNGTEHSHA